MRSKDHKDVIGGALLIAGGVILAAFSAANYDLGTVRRMGPGMFPFSLGVMLAILGVLIGLPALRRPGPGVEVRIFSPLFVLSGVASFAFIMPLMGLLPAAAALIAISSLAELKVRPVSLAALTVFMCGLTYLIFSVALNLPIRLFMWPF